MREYQKTKNNPYLLPHCLYMRVLYIIRDYGRLKSEAQGALCGAEGDGALCHADTKGKLCRGNTNGADNACESGTSCPAYNRDLQICPAYIKGILCKEKKGACSLVCAGEARAIEEALGLIPEFFREPVLNNIIYGCRYPLGADERTFRRYKQRFVYYVAKCLALV